MTSGLPRVYSRLVRSVPRARRERGESLLCEERACCARREHVVRNTVSHRLTRREPLTGKT